MQRVALLSEVGNDVRFDFYKDLIISIFELSKKQIAWCQQKNYLKDREQYKSISPKDKLCPEGLKILIEPFIKK